MEHNSPILEGVGWGEVGVGWRDVGGGSNSVKETVSHKTMHNMGFYIHQYQ